MDGQVKEVCRGAKKDQFVHSSLEQLREYGRVNERQLKGASEHLRLKDDAIYFDDRIVVPRALRIPVLERVHNECHFGQARTLEFMRRSYL